MRKYLKSKSGLVVLEYAALAVGVLPLIMLAVDAGHIFRTRTALQQSVQSTLRCLSPVDADCVAKANPQYEPVYKVSLKESDERWPVPQYQFAAEASWLGLPNYAYKNPEVTILNRVIYNRRFAPAFYNQSDYRVRADLNYSIQKTSSPFINTGINAITALNPEFQYQKSATVSYPSQKISLSAIGGTVREQRKNGEVFRKYIGSVSFKTPMVSKLPCYKSGQIDFYSTSHKANFNNDCDQPRIPVVLHITGHFPGDDLAEGSDGKVLLRLRGKDFSINGNESGNGTFNLGGRAFTYHDTQDIFANFVPRGGSLDNISHTHNYEEFIKYQNIQLSPDTEYTIDFYLQRTSSRAGRTGWRGRQLKIFYPLYQQEKVSLICAKENIVFIDGKRSCKQISYQGHSFFSFDLKNQTEEMFFVKTPMGCFDTRTIVAASNCPECEVWFDLNSQECSQSVRIELPCPANYGVPGDPNTDPVSKGIAGIACPVKDPLQVTDAIPYYVEGKHILYGIGFEYTKSNCDTSDIPDKSSYPALVKNYYKLHWTEVRRIEDKPLYTDLITPQAYREKYPEYNCPEINIEGKGYNFNQYTVDQVPAEIQNSLLYGSYSILDTGCAWQEAVRNETREVLGLDPDTYILSKRNYTSLIYSDIQPPELCYNLLPQPISKDLSSGSDANFDGVFKASALPAECNNPDYQCELELAGFERQGSDEINVDEQAAIQQGFNALQAAYPRAALNCETVDCFNMDIDFNGEDFTVQADIKVPLLSLMGQKEVTLSYQADAHWEGQYVR